MSNILSEAEEKYIEKKKEASVDRRKLRKVLKAIINSDIEINRVNEQIEKEYAYYIERKENFRNYCVNYFKEIFFAESFATSNGSCIVDIEDFERIYLDFLDKFTLCNKYSLSQKFEDVPTKPSSELTSEEFLSLIKNEKFWKAFKVYAIFDGQSYIKRMMSSYKQVAVETSKRVHRYEVLFDMLLKVHVKNPIKAIDKKYNELNTTVQNNVTAYKTLDNIDDMIGKSNFFLENMGKVFESFEYSSYDNAAKVLNSWIKYKNILINRIVENSEVGKKIASLKGADFRNAIISEILTDEVIGGIDAKTAFKLGKEYRTLASNTPRKQLLRYIDKKMEEDEK